MSEGAALHAGQVAQFVFLHKDTARRVGNVDQETFVYEVNAKSRPMLVLARSRVEHGGRVYPVAPITSRGCKPDGTVKRNHRFIGDCIERGKMSYVKLEVEYYPECLLVNREARQVNDQNALDAFLKNWAFMKLGLPW